MKMTVAVPASISIHLKDFQFIKRRERKREKFINSVQSNSRNGVPRVAQWYGTMAGHTQRRVSFLVMFCSVFACTCTVLPV